LRLRDAYLIGVITSFLGKLLRSLGEYSLEVGAKAAQYIKDACKTEREPGFKKTNLTPQQKAELQRVLSEHQGVELLEIQTKMAVKKQGTIDFWSSSAGGKIHEPRLPQPGHTALPDRGAKSSMASLALMKQLAEQRAKEAKAAKDAAAVDSSKAFLNKRREAEAERKREKDKALAKIRALRGPGGVSGEGSGIQGLNGLDGKDHTPLKSEIMVGSSDEDSSDDDGEVDDSNTLLKLRKKTSSNVTDYEESKRRALKQMQQGPVRKTKIQRSAKDLRARVEPNMDALYIEILSWDIFHQGDSPPSNVECRKIADKFYDISLYKQTFAPLLISEVWRSLVTAREENLSKPIEITILNRVSVDKFMEVSTKMPISTNRDLKFNERDVILLSRSTDPINNPGEAHCLARVDRTSRKKEFVEVTFRVSRNIEQDLLAGFAPNSKISAVKIADMTTTQREYAALSSLDYYDLCPEVLEAKPSPIQKQNETQITEIVSRYSLNRGQAKAILAAVDNDGFTLIQG
jgi:senataxin